MIRINRKTEYAIRMLLSLSKKEEGIRASTAEIQREMLIPRAFAQQIIAKLARGSFIKTFPGREGGVMLARPAKEINLLQLLEYFEHYLFASGCQDTIGECPLQEECPICAQLEYLKTVMSYELENINLEDLAKGSKRQRLLVFSNVQQRISVPV